MKSRSYAKRALALILTIIIITSSAFSLFSCGKGVGGKDELLSKEELINASLSETKELDTVAEYLDRWGFPRFSMPKLEALERIYRSKFVEQLPTPLEKAREVAAYFIEFFYDEVEIADPLATTDMYIYSFVETVNDKYSIYRTAEEYDDYDTNMSGAFVGIGVSVEYNVITNEILVISVTPGSGAEVAGILSEDYIIKIDGTDVKEIGYEEALSRVKGEEGTTVLITVLRGSEEKTFSVTRRRIVEQSVSYTMIESIGYIKITSFKANTAAQFRAAVDAVTASNAKGIIYDLRDNHGGYLDAVVNMLDYLVPKGTEIVSFTNDYADPIYAKDNHKLNIPAVVICNEETASAGELFTAGIRDFAALGHFSATIVGTTTFGKGIMQNTYLFSDNSSITMTVAYYNPPLGENYHGIGIEPNTVVEESEEGDAQLDAAYKEILYLIH